MSLVLVVDDQPTTRAALCRALLREGHEPVSASDPGEAVERWDGRPPDVLLLDVNPGCCGADELLDAVRREPRWEAVPVVLLTSEAEARDVRGRAARGLCPVRAASSLRQVIECVRCAAAAP